MYTQVGLMPREQGMEGPVWSLRTSSPFHSSLWPLALLWAK